MYESFYFFQEQTQKQVSLKRREKMLSKVYALKTKRQLLNEWNHLAKIKNSIFASRTKTLLPVFNAFKRVTAEKKRRSLVVKYFKIKLLRKLFNRFKAHRIINQDQKETILLAMGSLKKHAHYQSQKIHYMNKKIVFRKFKKFIELSKEGKIDNSLLIMKE